MKNTALVTIYSLTLLISAALLFSVQPMFSKMILPLLGGTPQVWNTAMLFFQVMLLAGYGYAHGTSRYLSVRTQSALHIVLLLLFTVALPIMIPAGWQPTGNENPALWQLSLMAMTVGGPFFILAGSAPMLQRWFTVSGHKDAANPYFLYGASNLGSMSALLAYPVLIEPLLTTDDQSRIWMMGYFALIALTALSALTIWRHAVARQDRQEEADNNEIITWEMRFNWIILAFIPSSLMLGVTTFITTDIAAVPLLWILPLAVYVGTFIIAFARKPLLDLKQSTFFVGLVLIILANQRIAFNFSNPTTHILLHLLVFFLVALNCHNELAKTRPSAAKLTEFYLLMSLGGALGGFFNAIIAPQLLIIPVEYMLALIAASYVRFYSDENQTLSRAITSLKQKKFKILRSPDFVTIIVGLAIISLATILSYKTTTLIASIAGLISLGLLIEKRWPFAILVTGIFLLYPLGFYWNNQKGAKSIHRDRNFFGVLKIVNSEEGVRRLLNGTTDHGAQMLDPANKKTLVSYYSKNSPLSDVFRYVDHQNASSQEVAVIGLGVGVTACYNRQGRHFDYFEINEKVKDIAENKEYFTFLSDCGSPYRIIMGDGRLTIQKEPDQKYDLFIVDAFSSDNIPVHLLTLEALEIYLSKIKQDGILIIHISNRHLDLEPVLQKASEALGIEAYAKLSESEKIAGTKLKSYPSHWVVLTKNPDVISDLVANKWTKAMKREGINLWTDQYSNIFGVINNQSGMARSKEHHVLKRFNKSKPENESTSSP